MSRRQEPALDPLKPPDRPLPPDSSQLDEEQQQQQQQQTFRQRRAAEIARKNVAGRLPPFDGTVVVGSRPGAIPVQGIGRNGWGATPEEEEGTVVYSMGGATSTGPETSITTTTTTTRPPIDDEEENLVEAELAPKTVEGFAEVATASASSSSVNPATFSWSKPMVAIVSVLFAIFIGIVVLIVFVVGSQSQQEDTPPPPTTTTTSPITSSPSDGPTISPTLRPTTPQPTTKPISLPTTLRPTPNPTLSPTARSTDSPSDRPSPAPTSSPTTSSPTISPTLRPTTPKPTPNPTPLPTAPSPNPLPTNSAATDIAISMLRPYIPNIPSSIIQQQALDWLINNDDGLIASQDSDRLLDRYVMAIIYLSTNGEGWEENDGWLSQESVCTWDLVDISDYPLCPQENGRVDNIDLTHNNLEGTIPTEIGVLSELTVLTLGINNLEGTIPTEIGMLTKLTWLFLGDNQLVGTIPSQLGRLTALTTLYLWSTNLTGSIPAELDSFLSSVTSCGLYDNPGLTGIPANCERM